MRLKARFDQNGYVLLNCKLYAWAYHRAIRTGDTPPRYKNFKITAEDAKFLRSLDLSHIPRRYHALTLEQMGRCLGMLTDQDVETYISKFSYRKHKFLVEHFGEEFDDIKQRLREAGLYGVYRQYPFFNPKSEQQMQGHMIAYAKIALRNDGKNLIQEYTTQSRQRLTKDNESLDETQSEFIASPEVDTFVTDGLSALAKLESRMTPKVRRFLLIMSGQHDAEFSAFLGRDNSAVVERMDFDSYSAKVKTFLSVSDRNVANLYQMIRERTGYHTH